MNASNNCVREKYLPDEKSKSISTYDISAVVDI